MNRKFRIAVLDTAAQTHNSYIPIAIVDALQRNPAVEFVRQVDYGNAIDLFRRERCDTFLALGGAGGDFAVISRLCAIAERSVLWTTEDPYELEENLRLASAFDNVFTNDLACLPIYGERAHHLPLSGSLLFHDIEPVMDETSFLYDVCFVGTAWPNRVQTINRILDTMRRPLRMKIALPGNPYLPPVILNDSALYTNWRVPNPELARIANLSRITLNLERKFSGSRPDQASGSTPPPRLFENALAGAFQISLGSGSEAKRYFDPDSEIAFCDDEDALLDRIEWALDHPKLRISMAQAARRRAQSEHLYDHRVGTILKVLGDTRVTAPARQRTRERKRLLLVTHNVAGHQPGGGIEAYQDELAQGATAFEVYTLFPQTIEGSTTYVLVAHGTGERHHYGVPHPAGSEFLHDESHERIFERILIENDIDLVHFQHLLGMPLSLPFIARACGVPSLYTLHDFYLVCTRFNLLDYRGRFCDIARRSPTECEICLSATGAPDGAQQQRRRNFITRMLEAVDYLVANSPYTADYLRAIYPEIPAGKIRIVEMLTPASHYTRIAAPVSPPTQRKPNLRIAIPGNFTWAKGADAVLRIMNALRDAPVDFFILGAIQEPALDQHVRSLTLPRLTIIGGYVPREMPRLMSDMDVSLHLSTWPETYMISLNEAWMSGVVPVVSNLGAPAERVREGIDGFKVEPDDVGRVCDIIRDLSGDRERLNTMREAAFAHRIVSPTEHVAALTALYDKLVAESPVPPLGVKIKAERDYSLSTRTCGIRTTTPFWTQAGSGWDAPPPPRHQARVVRELTVWRTFPMRFAHIARKTLPSEERDQLALMVESVEADHSTASMPQVLVKKTFGLRGWAFVKGYGPPLDILVHVKGRGQEYYVVSQPHLRADVSTWLNEPEAENSGFEFELDLSELSEGAHDIHLLQVYDGIVIDLGRLGEAVISRNDAEQPAATPHGTVFDPSQSASVRTVVGDAEILQLTPPNTSAEPKLLTVEGWAADRGQYRVLPTIHVGFVPRGDQAIWSKGTRSRAPAPLLAVDPLFAFCGFQATVALSRVPPGLHRIVVAESSQSETLVHEIGEAVMILPDRITTLSRDIELGVGKTDIARSDTAPDEHYAYLESVETDMSGQPEEQVIEGSTHLYVRGWAYVPSLGKAEEFTLRLIGSAATLQVVRYPTSRWDVAKHLDADEAASTGFEVLVPLAGLPPGRYAAELLYAAGETTTLLPLTLGLEITDTSVAAPYRLKQNLAEVAIGTPS